MRRRLSFLTYVVGTVVTIVERRHGRGADASCGRRGQNRGGGAFAVSHDLRLHRQCGLLRAADFQSRQSRDLRQPYAAACHLAAGLCIAVRALDRRYFVVLRWSRVAEDELEKEIPVQTLSTGDLTPR